MALCPFCFDTDKSFFATKCPSCNSWVPFTLQIFWSLTSSVAIIVAFIWVMGWGLPLFFDLIIWLLD